MGEEMGSPGLRELCRQHAQALAADVFIASDGPRVAAQSPTLFLGSRGIANFRLSVKLREGAHHSGNWGGLLRNAGTRLAHALASVVDARGRVRVKGLLPQSLPANVRAALQGIGVGGGAGDPEIDPAWGEPGLSPTERVYAWNTFEVLAFKTGNPDAPVGAIPGHAFALCQIRFVVGSDSANFARHLREHLDAHGFDDVIVQPDGEVMHATRLDPDDAWVRWALDSVARTTGMQPALLPNFGGSLPNDVFAEVLGLPTLWVPHSYPACSQHAPNEHLLGSVARQALQIMAGLFWDLAEGGAAVAAGRTRGPDPWRPQAPCASGCPVARHIAIEEKEPDVPSFFASFDAWIPAASAQAGRDGDGAACGIVPASAPPCAVPLGEDGAADSSLSQQTRTAAPKL